MLIKITKNMTDSEHIAAENSNNQYLQGAWYTSELDDVAWTCIKRNDGTAECYCSIPYEVSTPSSVGSTYIYQVQVGNKRVPIEFIQNPNISISLTPNVNNHWTSNLGLSSGTIKLLVLYSYTDAGVKGTAHITLKGRWK